jgi:TP901 family phage tail tape measure protein
VGAVTEEARAWEEEVERLKRAYMEASEDVTNAQFEMLTGDADELKTRLMFRRRELEGPMQDEMAFWKEWSMESVKQAADSLRSYGQSQAAAALEEMETISSERTRLQAQMKRAFGGLQKGGEVEMPEAAEGTMVDFISAERALGSVVESTTDALHQQYLELRKVIKRMDEAKLAMAGLGEAERYAVGKLQKQAKSEVLDVYRAKKGTSVEELAGGETEVLGRLTQQVAQITDLADRALADPVIQASERIGAEIKEAMIEAMAAREVEDSAEETGKGIVGIWEWVKDQLVGHSVIPDMVKLINKYLDTIGEDQEADAKVRVELAKAEAQERKEIAKRETVELREQVKARERAARETQRLAQLEGEAKQRASALGISWDRVQQEMEEADADINTIIGSLKRTEREQADINRQARRMEGDYEDAGNAVTRFARALNNAREGSQGIGLLANDLQDISQGLAMRGTAITGGLTVAARDFVNLRKEADAASRALGLNREMSDRMAEGIVNLSADLAVLDPESTAQGVTAWATATGQLVETQEDLNALLSQTAPVQQLAMLGQADIGTVTDATTASINQFELSLADTTRVVSVFNKVSDDTLAEIDHVAEAFKYVGTDAASLGESIEDVGAQLSVLADNAIRGSQAGTSLRSVYKNLATPTAAAADELERLFGVQQPFFDQEGNWIGMARAVDMLAAATADMTDEQRRATLGEVFETDALNAMIQLIREQTKAREEGVNALEARAEDLGQTALDTWEQKVGDWEESDVYRVEQAKMRWKAMWLTIGQQGLDMALPYLELATGYVDEFTQALERYPWITEVGAAIGAGGLGLAGILSAITIATKTVNMIRSTLTAFEAAMKGRPSAEQQFQTTVISAAEQFAQIVRQSAVEEGEIEKADAVEEAQIEKSGALEEAQIEKSSALNVASLLGRTMGALAIAGVGSQALTGQGIGGWFSREEGVAAGQARLGEFAGLSEEELRAELGTLTEQIAALNEVVGPDTGIFTFLDRDFWEGAFGAGDQGQIIKDLMGPVQSFSATAMVDKLAELEELQAGIEAALASGDGIDDFDQKWIELARVETEAAEVTATHTYTLYEYNRTAQDTIQLTDAEVNAAKLYVEMLQEQEQAITDFNAELAEVNRELQDDLAQMERDYYASREQRTQQFHESQAESERQHQERQAQDAAEHAKRMRRMEEDFKEREQDLIASRDAYGLIRERRQHEKEKSRAEEDYADQQAQRQQQYEQQRAQRQQQYEQDMLDAEAQYQEQREQRILEHQEQVAEMQAEHEEDMARLREQYFDKINAELEYYSRSEEQQQQYHAAMLEDTKAWLEANRSIWQDYVANLPTPSSGYGSDSGDGMSAWDQYTQYSGSYQSGGYIPITGLANVHAGEFVLTPSTTRMAEAAAGGSLTQDSLLASMTAQQSDGGRRVSINIPIQASFSGMRAQDMETVRGELHSLERRVYRNLSEQMEEA